MTLHLLSIQSLRNLSSLQLTFSSSVNVFYGNNGSGKTSVVEAIHMAALGRSFRTRLSSQLIQRDKEHFIIFARFQQGATVGIEKHREGPIRLKFNGDLLSSAIRLAEIMPLQLLYTESFQLILSSPKVRRQFLNWGMFHVEQGFLPLWERIQGYLMQRNALLKQRVSDLPQLKVWDEVFVASAEALNRLRQSYLASFQPYFARFTQAFFKDSVFSIRYHPGWHEGRGLAQCLNQSLERDRRLGYTQYGPQRAEWEIDCDGEPIQKFFSRGQLKLLICALRLAQGQHLFELTGKSCLYLVDDLASELDPTHREYMMLALKNMQAQLFVTGIERETLSFLTESEEAKTFHVKQGEVTEEIR